VTSANAVEPFDVPELEVPDFVEPIEVWRVWRVVVDERGSWLGSIVKPTIWPSGDAFVAECLHAGPVGRWVERRRGGAHSAPASDCSCGIYGAGLPQLRPYLADSPMDARATRVLGQVALWGTVIECEHGFRASHAYPRRVYIPSDLSSKAGRHRDALASGLEAYGVPIRILPAPLSSAFHLLTQQNARATYGT
jgi:hypothetical protein